jgi:hypothetical protein
MLFLIFVSTSSLSGVGATSAGEGAQNLSRAPFPAPESTCMLAKVYSNIFKHIETKHSEEHIFWVSPGETGKSSQFGFEEKRSRDLVDDKSLHYMQ